MRLSASEKHEIIQIVTRSEIGVKRVVLHHFVDNKYNYFSFDFSISYGVFPLNDPCGLLKL